jgi:hypothetical protein
MIMADPDADLLGKMPDTFRFSEALEHINKRQFYKLLADGRITPIARGLYRKSDWHGDEDLIDDIPDMLDIALPRGTWAPRISTPVKWHRFDPNTFDIGRDTLDIGAGKEIGIYSAPRSIIDAYRLQHHEGIDLANEALKRWLRHGGQPSELLRMARSFPHAQRALQQTLSILL